jgi:hypothetical protein
MLGPPALTTAQLTVATKPTAGYEEQLWSSVNQYTNPGNIFLAGLNSGVYNSNNADAAQLLAVPQELIAVLDVPINSASPIVVTLVGTGSDGSPLTGTATFAPPSFAQTQENVFPQAWGVDVVPNRTGITFASITPGLCSAANAIDTVNAYIQIYGLPSFSLNIANNSVAGAYRLVSAKTKLDYNPRVAVPHPVQVGRDMSKFVKPGEIQRGDCMISQKVQSDGDGLMRLNGVRTTSVVRIIKESTVELARTYLLGLIVTAKKNTGQSVEDVEAVGEGLFEHSATVIAGS